REATMKKLFRVGLPLLLFCVAPLVVSAQSFRVQCPTSTITHPDPSNSGVNSSEPAYNGPTYTGTSADYTTGRTGPANGAIKCQQIGGGDGFSTMGDGTQIYMFSFGPLSGLADIANGLPGTEFPRVFNSVYSGSTPLQPGDPATTGSGFSYNGAVGLVPDLDNGGVIDGHVDPRPIEDVGV